MRAAHRAHLGSKAGSLDDLHRKFKPAAAPTIGHMYDPTRIFVAQLNDCSGEIHGERRGAALVVDNINGRPGGCKLEDRIWKALPAHAKHP